MHNWNAFALLVFEGLIRSLRWACWRAKMGQCVPTPVKSIQIHYSTRKKGNLKLVRYVRSPLEHSTGARKWIEININIAFVKPKRRRGNVKTKRNIELLWGMIFQPNSIQLSRLNVMLEGQRWIGCRKKTKEENQLCNIKHSEFLRIVDSAI